MLITKKNSNYRLISLSSNLINVKYARKNYVKCSNSKSASPLILGIVFKGWLEKQEELPIVFETFLSTKTKLRHSHIQGFFQQDSVDGSIDGSADISCLKTGFYATSDRLLLNAWCPLKVHTYLNKIAAESRRFVYV